MNETDTIKMLYDGYDCVADYNDADNLLRHYITPGLDENVLVYDVDNTEEYFYLHDGLGTVRQIINDTQTIENNYDYEGFGTSISHSENIYNRYRYTGREYDKYKNYFEDLETKKREVTEQDRVIHSLLRPERLLEFVYKYILFDNGEKKVARYQQYYCVESLLNRVKTFNNDGNRQGGVVWHTQGSGKSLTMVWFAKALALEKSINEPRIVLVTDRTDLDDQIYNTFRQCGLNVFQASTGEELISLLRDRSKCVITTVVDKFDAAVNKLNYKLDTSNVFVLVDEGHRGHYKTRHARLRKTMPNACLIAFTGTPIKRKDRDTFNQFGGLIDKYTIKEAIKDKAVVPLLYEGRHVPQHVDTDAIDRWFDNITKPLSDKQRVDLKKKFSTTEQMNTAEQKVKMIAWDISNHYQQNWQGTGFKAQLVTSNKKTALAYKKFLDEFGLVTSEVLISSPDNREGEESATEESTQEVRVFWNSIKDKYGSEKQYNKQLISAFKHCEEPEMIIVVDKLLTGFDSTRNTILYVTRRLKDHTLLQAIARVNRLHEGKEFGYIIDYRGVLHELDEAIKFYETLKEFESDDLEDVFTNIDEEIKNLPDKHTNLWDLFKTIKNKKDAEEFEIFLKNEEIRAEFYEKFMLFAKALSIAMSSVKFIEDTPQETISIYENDLKFFKELRTAVRRRYAEEIDFSEYEPKIKKLIDTHVGTDEVKQITGRVDIFNKTEFDKAVQEATSNRSKAETIASNLTKTITEKWDEDPAFYRKFSVMIQNAINEMEEERLSEAEVVNKLKSYSDSIINHDSDDFPKVLKNKDMAKRYYGCVNEEFSSYENLDEEIRAEVSINIDSIISSLEIRDWVRNNNEDVKKAMENQIEDYLCDLFNQHEIGIDYDLIDRILEKCIGIAAKMSNNNE